MSGAELLSTAMGAVSLVCWLFVARLVAAIPSFTPPRRSGIRAGCFLSLLGTAGLGGIAWAERWPSTGLWVASSAVILWAAWCVRPPRPPRRRRAPALTGAR